MAEKYSGLLNKYVNPKQNSSKPYPNPDIYEKEQVEFILECKAGLIFKYQLM